MLGRFVVAFGMTVMISGALTFGKTKPGQGENSSTLQFTLRRNYQVVIPVSIDGGGARNFILDTGTKTTVVDERLSRTLGHSPIARMPFTTFTETIEVPIVRLETLRVGIASFTGIEVSCLDLRKAYSLDDDISGILGQNVLSQLSYLLDYRARRITIDSNGTLERNLIGMQIPLQSRDMRDHFVYESSTPTERPFGFLLDSGTPLTVIFEERAQDLGVRIERESPRSFLANESGARPIETGRIGSLHIGGVKMKNLAVYVTPGRRKEQRWEGGLLPTSLFDSLYFDHANGRVIINARLAEGPRYADSGPNSPIKFRLVRKYIVMVRGSIGKLGGLNMVVDTGAVPSVISTRVASKLGLKGTVEKLSVFNTEIDARSLLLPSVAIGPLQVSGVSALARDLSPIEEHLGVPVDALIGLDVIGRSSFTIDYGSERIMVHSAMDQMDIAQSSSGAGTPGIAVNAVADGQPLRLLVDTGANQIILFRRRVEDRLRGSPSDGLKRMTNLAGEAGLREVRLKSFRLGSTDFGQRTVLMVETGDSPLPDYDGVLGIASLRLRRVRFDVALGTISWEAP